MRFFLRLSPIVLTAAVAALIGATGCEIPARSADGSGASQGQGKLGVSYVVSFSRPVGGAIRSSDGLVNCGTTATGRDACGPVQYAWGQTASFTAEPDAGYLFYSWAADCTGNEGCSVSTAQFGADKWVAAAFLTRSLPGGFAVTVQRPAGGTITSSDGRINCGTPGGTANACGPQIYRQAQGLITLTATPDPGYRLRTWAGDCAGDGVCTIDASVLAYRQVAAVFDGRAAGFADFTGVARSNVLWFDYATGSFYESPVNGFAVGAPTLIYGDAFLLEWRVFGVGDIDGDGRSDILWRDLRQGSVWFGAASTWLGGAIGGGIVLQNGVPNAWQIVGVGDFDHDGKADLLWRNLFTGQTRIWFMASPVTGFTAVDLAFPAPLSQLVVGVADFDGDGVDDVVWRDASTGQLSVWHFDGTRAPALRAAPLTTVARSQVVVQVARFAGNGGKPGLVLRDMANGDCALWLTDGAAVTSKVPLVTRPTGLPLVQVADFDGDGNPDLLWRDPATGSLTMDLVRPGTVPVLQSQAITAPAGTAAYTIVP